MTMLRLFSVIIALAVGLGVVALTASYAAGAAFAVAGYFTPIAIHEAVKAAIKSK